MVIAVFVFIILWNWSLKSQVKRRTEQLENAQKQLIHAEKMESIGRLSAGVAHEVKNPLAIMQMSIDYLKGEENDETVTAILNDMDDAVLRADTVIKGLLDFSRKDQQNFEYKHLHKILKETYDLMAHQMKMVDISFYTDYSARSDLIYCSENQIKQACVAILVNASEAAMALMAGSEIDPSLIKGTGAGGRITKPDVEAYLNDQG